ncbi:hypothetical protein COCCADRAFT_67430, partial [Bipolaris zeicola 26-R-13]
AGLPRTGTTSLKAALEILGLKPCLHYADVMQETYPCTQSRRWKQALSLYGDEHKAARQALLRQIFEQGRYAATLAYPASVFVQDLVEIYPDTQVVHSIRSSTAVWKNSVDSAMRPVESGYSGRTLLALWTRLLKPSSLRPDLVAWGRRQFGAGYRDANNAQLYEGYNEFVKEVVPPERLLPDFESTAGWGPLCDLLGVPVPVDEHGEPIPYPRLNDRATMENRRKARVTRGLMYWAIVVGI